METASVTLIVSSVSVVVALAAFTVGFSQMRIASAKVKLDLYNKRFAVYESALDYYLAYFGKLDIPLGEAGATYVKHFRESKFLFARDDGIYDTLKGIAEFVGSMSAHNEQLRDRPNEINAHIHERGNEAALKFASELEKLETQMEKYLSFKTVEGWRWR